MELPKEIPALVCSNCKEREIPKGRRKYCDPCGSQASLIWKRAQRQNWRKSGQVYWRDNWKHATEAEKRAYFRIYMKAYRFRKRETTKRGSANLAPMERGR
jgi:hypothetical protein